MTEIITTLATVGRALHGPAWQRGLARNLGTVHASVRQTTVRRWLAGEQPTPDWLPAALVAVLRQGAAQRASEARVLVELADGITTG